MIDILLFISFFVTIIFTIFITIKARENPVLYFLALATFSCCIWQISIILFWQTNFIVSFHNLAFVGPAFLPWFTFVFINNFPTKKITLTNKQYFILLLPTIFFSIIILFFPHYFLGPININTQLYERKLGYYLYVIYLIGSFGAITTILLHNALTYKGLAKLQASYLLLAIFITICFGTFFNLIIPVFNQGDFSYTKLGPISLIFFVTVLTYFFIKHRLFGIQFIIKKSLIYFFLITTVFFVFISFVFLSGSFVNNYFSTNKYLTIIIASAIIVFIYPYLKNFINITTNRVFFKYHPNFQASLKQLSQNLSKLNNLEKITSLLIDSFFQNLRVKHLAIFFQDQNKNYVLSDSLSYEGPKKISNNSLLVNVCQQNPEILILEDFRFRIKKINNYEDKLKFMALREELKLYSAEIIVPLFNGTNLIGILILGSKLSEDTYNNEEINYIQTSLNQVNTAIQNALQYHEILETKNFNEEILLNMTTGVITINKDLAITMFNLKAEQLFNLNINAIKGRCITELFDICNNLNLFEKSLLEKKAFQVEGVIKLKHKEINVNIATDVLRNIDKNEIGVIGVITDLTNVKAMQKQIEQANRLSSLGTMAAGIAHEIKNPLVAIKTFSEMLQKMWQDPNFRQKYQEIVTPQVDRINTLCQALLKLGKPQKIELTEFKIEKIIQEVLTLLEGERKFYHADIFAEITPHLLFKGDHGQILQVFLNLLINALQALPQPEGGEIYLKTQLLSEYGYILITIKDTGTGIPQDRLNSIFDPFYTTKAEGTGLGLSIVFKIIEEHKGKILVESQLNQGTVFKIYLPTNSADPEKLIQLITLQEKI